MQPFATSLPVRMCYHLVTSPNKANLARTRAFREWILEESAYLREREGLLIESARPRAAVSGRAGPSRRVLTPNPFELAAHARVHFP